MTKSLNYKEKGTEYFINELFRDKTEIVLDFTLSSVILPSRRD